MPQNGFGTARASRRISDADLLKVQKPAQYIGGELNSVTKDDAAVDVHFALGFPDTYEVGMSHLGIQILYSILNNDPRTWAERVYMPMSDMEELMRAENLPLCSLESGRPLSEFDLVGFSLQYELCGTNILAMLERGGLAFLSVDRRDSDPIVIGGGPYSYHPEALSPFFDAFFLGDAEEAILEVVETVRKQKQSGTYSRKAVLHAMRNVGGIYLPGDYTPNYDGEGRFLGVTPHPAAPSIVVRRLLPTLENVPYPKKPVVPNIQTVHNRLSVEVMRGCVRGCRFCQAGYLYRPQRERSPEEIRDMIAETLPNSGYEEISLLSLSTADYCSIVPLLKNLMDTFAADDRLAISFPSTRVDALTPEVLEQVQRVRRTGFTVAPEAGTQRLRDVINKGVTDDQIVETCSNVFKMGWTGIKLYFMLGLPTETEEDLDGIISIATRVKQLPEARGKDVTVSVSTMVPKPHTPFQWAEQISVEETIRRQRYLGDRLRKVGATFRYHDAFSTFLEGVFCRAGRELAPAVLRAYELGCRLDAWQDHLREEIWLQAFQETNIDATTYLRPRDDDEPFAWDHLSCGIPKSYFLKEWERANRAKETPDCLKTSCSTCGACDYNTKRNILWPRAEAEVALGWEAKASDESAATAPASDTATSDPHTSTPKSGPAVPNQDDLPVQRVRLTYEKQDTYRFVGHLELVSIFHRAARRAGIPLAFSRGFHPMPRLAFGPPLQLGVESHHEYVDAMLIETLGGTELMTLFNDALPFGISISRAEMLPLRGMSLHESIGGHRFSATWAGGYPGGTLGAVFRRMVEESRTAATIDEVESLLSVSVSRKREKKASGKPGRGGRRAPVAHEKQFLLRDYISELALTPTSTDVPGGHEMLCTVSFLLRADHREACPKPTEAILLWTEGERLGDFSLVKRETLFANVESNPHALRPADDIVLTEKSLIGVATL